MLRAKEIVPRAIWGMRALDLSALTKGVYETGLYSYSSLFRYAFRFSLWVHELILRFMCAHGNQHICQRYSFTWSRN